MLAGPADTRAVSPSTCSVKVTAEHSGLPTVVGTTLRYRQSTQSRTVNQFSCCLGKTTVCPYLRLIRSASQGRL